MAEDDSKTEKRETSNALIKVDISGKPAEKLIDKIARGIRGAAAPWQIRRVARAKADAALIKAESDIQISELQRRAMYRLVEEEARHQHNMEAITAKSVPLLEEGANPDTVDDDWIANFFDQSRSVSNDEMQSLWARVLAGEVNKPGSFSRRTVNFLRDLDRADCEEFTRVCRFACDVAGLVPLIFDEREPIYKDNGISVAGLQHLENIGLVKHEAFERLNIPSTVETKYFDETITLQTTTNRIHLGRVRFTLEGHQLSAISGATPIAGFADYLRGRWQWFRHPITVANPTRKHAPTVDVPAINRVVSSLSKEVNELGRSQVSIEEEVTSLTRRIED